MTILNRILTAAQKKVRKSPAIDYLRSRGVSDRQIDDIGIGYIPEDKWPPYIKGDSEDVLSYLEWSSKGYRLRGKLVFPMRNPYGILRGIQIRSPDRDKKDYSKFYLQRSKVDAVFFGAEMAMPYIWEKREVYLCEGLFDFFPLQRIFPHTICTGTANVSKRQIIFLKRFVDHVNVVFDMDWGGNEFWKRFQEEHGSDFKSMRRVELRGKDVSEVWETLGDKGLKERLTRRLLV